MQRLGKHTSITREELLRNGVFFEYDPWLYNEGPRQAEIELRKSLVTAVEND
jgi:hypothetical protein